MDVETSEDATQYLTFFVGDEEFGLRILESREIIQYPTVTRVPAMPPAVRGVTNLRGSVVPVVDLALLFGQPERPRTKWTCLLVVETAQGDSPTTSLVGLVVDAVSQVVDLAENDVEATPSFGTHVKRRYLRGMARSGSKFVLLLDLPRVLAGIDLSDVGAVEATGATPAESST